MSTKDFKNNPALSYLVKEPELVSKNTKPKRNKPGYRVNLYNLEPKSKRVALLMQPAQHDELRIIADENRISINETINIAIDLLIKKVNGRK